MRRYLLAIFTLFLIQSFAQTTLAGTVEVSPQHTRWRVGLSHIIRVKAGINVIEAVVKEDKAFEVTKAFLGHLRVGNKLLFSDCRQINRFGSTEDYLRSILRASVIDAPILSDNTFALPNNTELDSFSPPEPASAFIMVLWRFHGARWGFTRQTHDDLFLVQGGKVFHLVYLSRSEDFQRVWLPLMPEQGYSEFVTLVEHEITERENLAVIR